MSLSKELSEDAIRAHVGGDVDTVKRGIVYAKSGAVTNLELRGSTLHARVDGGGVEPYIVWASFAAADTSQIAVSYCNCRAGHDGRCKHVAAALWAWQRKFVVDRSLLKRIKTTSPASTTAATATGVSPHRRTRAAEGSRAESKRPRKDHTVKKETNDRVHDDDDDAEVSVTSRPCMMDLSQDVEIHIAGARERDVVAAQQAAAAAAAAAAAPVDDARPASFFNRAIIEFQNHSSSLSTNDAAAAAAGFTTLESFNEMRREIRQLTLLLRWVRLASKGRIARLEQRIGALQRDLRVKDEQLFRRDQPHQPTFEDYLSAEVADDAKSPASPPPPPPQSSERPRRSAKKTNKKRDHAPRLPEYAESAVDDDDD
jgi:uncharacterized Zn finger protein